MAWGTTNQINMLTLNLEANISEFPSRMLAVFTLVRGVQHFTAAAGMQLILQLFCQ